MKRLLFVLVVLVVVITLGLRTGQRIAPPTIGDRVTARLPGLDAEFRGTVVDAPRVGANLCLAVKNDRGRVVVFAPANVSRD